MKKARWNIIFALLAAFALVFAAGCSDSLDDSDYADEDYSTEGPVDTDNAKDINVTEESGKPSDKQQDSEDIENSDGKQDQSGGQGADGGEAQATAITAVDVEELLQGIGAVVGRYGYNTTRCRWDFENGELDAKADEGCAFTVAWVTERDNLLPQIKTTLTNLKKAATATSLLSVDLSNAEWDKDREQTEANSSGIRYMTVKIALAEGAGNYTLPSELQSVTIAFDSDPYKWSAG